MNKKELIRRAALVLKENGIGKTVSIPKHTFYISDDEGNTKVFPVNRKDRKYIYTAADIESVIDACLYEIMEALRSGESVNIHGFGSFNVVYRKPSRVNNVWDGKSVIVEGHYAPKFSCGNDLKRCAQIYEQSLADKEATSPPAFDEDDTDSEDEL